MLGGHVLLSGTTWSNVRNIVHHMHRRLILRRQLRNAHDMQRGVLLPCERNDGYWRRNGRYLHRGVLLPRRLRLRERSHKCRHLHDDSQSMHLCGRQLLPRGVRYNGGRHMYRGFVLHGYWRGAGAVQRGCLWLDRSIGGHLQRRVQRGLLLPRRRDDGNRGWYWRPVHMRCRRGHVLPGGCDDRHVLHRVHRWIVLCWQRCNSYHMHCRVLLPCKRLHRHRQRAVHRGLLLPRWRDDRNGQRPVQRGFLLPPGLRVQQRRH